MYLTVEKDTQCSHTLFKLMGRAFILTQESLALLRGPVHARQESELPRIVEELEGIRQECSRLCKLCRAVGVHVFPAQMEPVNGIVEALIRLVVSTERVITLYPLEYTERFSIGDTRNPILPLIEAFELLQEALRVWQTRGTFSDVSLVFRRVEAALRLSDHLIRLARAQLYQKIPPFSVLLLSSEFLDTLKEMVAQGLLATRRLELAALDVLP